MSRPIGQYGDWDMSFRDAGNEVGNMRGTARVVFGADDDSNIAAQAALWATFITKTNALVLGVPISQRYIHQTDLSDTVPSNGATRELKLLVMYRCTATGTRHTLTVPTLSPTIPTYIVNVSVKDAISMTTPAAITEFITAFQAFVVAPNVPFNGATYPSDPLVTVVGLRVVGRNN